MLDRLWTRRLTAFALLMGLIGSVLMVVAPPSGADVTNPGAVVITLAGGTLSVNNGAFEADLVPADPQPGDVPSTITGAIDADGILTFPADGVFFPKVEDFEVIPGTFVDIQITALTAGTGFVNPFTGDAEVNMNLQTLIDFGSGIACAITAPLQLSTATAGGEAYDPADGTMTVADDTFAIPAVSWTNPAAAGVCGLVGSTLGLPAASGTNSSTFNMVLDPVITGTETENPDVTTPTLPPTSESPTTAPPSSAPTTAPATTPTTAPTTVQYLPGGSINPLYTCSGQDPDTQSVLDLLGDEPLTFQPTVTMAPVSPSPQQGEQFTASFSGNVTLNKDIVNAMIALGVTEGTVSNLKMTIKPGEGVSGADLVAARPTETFPLVSGQPAVLNIGPASAPFTRTSAVGGTVAFVMGEFSMTLATTVAGSDIVLNLACTPSGATVLSMTDGTAASGSTLPATGNDEQKTIWMLTAAVCLLLLGAMLVRYQRVVVRSGPAHMVDRA